MRLLDLLRPSLAFLEKAGIDDALTEAEILLFHAARTDRLTAYIENPEINSEFRSVLQALLERRAKGEPWQYIVGHVDFLGLTIRVGKGVLIPRPETELLVQEASEVIRQRILQVSRRAPEILDLCTGSGCIALSLAKEFPDARVVGVDNSEEALDFARQNAGLNKIRNVELVHGSLFLPLRGRGLFDIIVSNPPYIMTSEIRALQREVRDWEPTAALDGGKEGLDFYGKIFSEAGSYLVKDGVVIVEVGFGQADAVRETAEGSGFRNVSIKKDLCGIDRIVKALHV